MNWSDLISIVLVEPGESLNVGAISRLMANFNFVDLRLVNAVAFSSERAAITAVGATSALESARHFSSLPEALSDCQEAIGFSARGGKNRGENIALSELIERISTAVPRRTALVFGPEDNGLRQEHVEMCTTLVHIPTSPGYPSMNLSHAVGLALYSISMLTPQSERDEERAPLGDYEQLDKLVRTVARLTGFFHKGTPQPVPSVVKTLFRRLRLTPREMGILLGLFGTTHKTLIGESPLHPLDEEK